jgi:hypothetical protein
VTNGAGNYTIWVQRFLRYRSFDSQLASTSGSMGYDLPVAGGAKRVLPGHTVVCFAGNGCFLMNGQEFATAVQYSLPIIVCIVDNGCTGRYACIRSVTIRVECRRPICKIPISPPMRGHSVGMASVSNGRRTSPEPLIVQSRRDAARSFT